MPSETFETNDNQYKRRQSANIGRRKRIEIVKTLHSKTLTTEGNFKRSQWENIGYGLKLLRPKFLEIPFSLRHCNCDSFQSVLAGVT
jgi:hypothetical protein